MASSTVGWFKHELNCYNIGTKLWSSSDKTSKFKEVTSTAWQWCHSESIWSLIDRTAGVLILWMLTAPAVHITPTPQRERMLVPVDKQGKARRMWYTALKWTKKMVPNKWKKSTKTFLGDTKPDFLLWENLLFAWLGAGGIRRLIWKCCVAILMHLIMNDLPLIL